MIFRSIFSELEAQLFKPQATVITGMRRVGKTTALKFLLSKIEHANKIYIDFEKINTNLNVVAVKNSNGQIVFKDDNLWQLPVNTIYEIDCKKFTSGDYTLELKSFTTSCARTIHVK